MSSTRREFLQATGVGAAGVAATGGFLAAGHIAGAQGPPTDQVGLVATDGHIILPNRPGDAELYIFGFTSVPFGDSVASLINNYKGKAQTPAPILDFEAETDVNLKLTNLGLVVRPDLADSHTIHWHGFRTPAALMDGVPEVSVAVPVQRQFTYFYRPHDAGTYMYHCHFEDVEHVQMGMTGIVFVRPAGSPARAYDDPGTIFDRQFALLLNEIWTHPHDNLENIQESVWTDYDPNYWTINGRVYPQTVAPKDDPSLPSQPISSLIQCNGGDRVLLRLANLGYQQHSMQLPGVNLRVVGEDATLLRAPGGEDLSYRTNTLYIGPGEARDVLFTAPAFSAQNPTTTDGALGDHNTYLFSNRDASRLTNNGASGLGGMATEVRVYDQALPLQAEANETYG